MGFKCGLVGMPNVGKSSIFNLLTKQSIPANNYPFCTIDPNNAFVEVPDERLSKLSKINNSKKTVNAAIEFVDIAGLIKGASKGEGLGNEFLSHINSVDVIAHVVRFFEDKDIIHVKGSINPSDDFNDINLELILSDLNQVTKYLDRINKKKMEQKEKNRLSELLSSLIMHLEEEKFVSSYEKIEELYKIPDLKLLTSKPMFIIANIDDGYDKEILNAFKNTLSENQKCIVIDTKIEQEISQLSPEEQFEFLKELEISDTALNQIIQTGYQLLGLKTFFTSGEKETRAWSAKKEFNAGQCSGIIHTDIERGFIRAETVSYNDYISHNGEQGSKDNGVWRQEGKDYIVNEGDVIYFRFNV